MLFSVAANTTSATNPQGNTASNNVSASPPATSNAASTSDTTATSTSDKTDSTHDNNKPPDYEEALAYRKPAEEGYPEPSLVDGPQPPSYDAVY